MISIQKILVPIDFSPRCAWAARYASNLAHALNAQVFYLHAGAASSLARLREFVGPDAGDRAEVLEGDAAETVVGFARERSMDLIVMPTHAHGRFRRYLLGSVAAKVLHDASCPVWTGVHHQDAPLSDKADLRSIVCAVECDPSCLPLIRWSRDLADSVGAKLHVGHAVPAADETSDNRGEIELRKYLVCRAEAGFVRLFESAGMSVEVSLLGGPIVRAVRESALREKAGVVVIGRGHTQAGLGRLRTHAYAIIRESPCPVVSI